MNTRDLHIAEPCHADWNAMSGDEARKFCLECTKHVHHLSAMTEPEATALLDEAAEDESLCVRYGIDEDGEIVFAGACDTEQPRRRDLLVGAFAASLLLATPALASGVPDPNRGPSRLTQLYNWAWSWFEEPTGCSMPAATGPKPVEPVEMLMGDVAAAVPVEPTTPPTPPKPPEPPKPVKVEPPRIMGKIARPQKPPVRVVKGGIKAPKAR